MGSYDGLIDPTRIPGSELNPEKVSAAADALDVIAASVVTAADDVDTSWSAIPVSFVAPDAHLVYNGMQPATRKARGMATRFTKVAAALRTYAEELGTAKKALLKAKTDAETWLAEEFDDARRVWVLAHRTKQYEWDIQVSKVNIITDAFEYLRGRGETVREGWLGYPEIRANWLESGEHVDKNKQLLNAVADAYAALNALQVECANAINAQRDTKGEKLEAVDAEALKGSGEYAADLPWGKKVDGERTCTENFGQGAANVGLGLTNLIGGDYSEGEWSWKWSTAGEAWGGLATAAGSLALSTMPFTPILAGLGVPVFSDAWKNTQELLKGLVSWDKWFTNPAEAAGEVLTGLIPIGGWAAKGAKGARAAAAAAERAAAAAAKLRTAFNDVFGGGGNPKTGHGSGNPIGEAADNTSTSKVTSGGGAEGGTGHTGSHNTSTGNNTGTGHHGGGNDTSSGTGNHSNGNNTGGHGGDHGNGGGGNPKDTGNGNNTGHGGDGNSNGNNTGHGGDGNSGGNNTGHGGDGNSNGNNTGNGDGNNGGGNPKDGNGSTFTDSNGHDLSDVLEKSDLSKPELESYLQNSYPAEYHQYQQTGQWPADVQIPKDGSALTPGGQIDWKQVPNGGYELDAAGNAIKEPYAPKVGEVIDRYGPPNGRYTSPVPESGPYSYDQRSLPYVEDPAHYHQYKFDGDMNDIQSYVDKAPQQVADKVRAYMEKWDLTWSDLQIQRGTIAEGFGSKGGGIQYEFPMPIQYLLDLGILKEV